MLYVFIFRSIWQEQSNAVRIRDAMWPAKSVMKEDSERVQRKDVRNA